MIYRLKIAIFHSFRLWAFKSPQVGLSCPGNDGAVDALQWQVKGQPGCSTVRFIDRYGWIFNRATTQNHSLYHQTTGFLFEFSIYSSF